MMMPTIKVCKECICGTAVTGLPAQTHYQCPLWIYRDLNLDSSLFEVKLQPHSSSVLGLPTRLSYYLLKFYIFPPCACGFLPTLKRHDRKWTGDSKLTLGVKVSVSGALLCIPGVFSLSTQYPCERFWMLHEPTGIE